MQNRIFAAVLVWSLALSLCSGDQMSLACPLRQVGLDFAVSLQPWRPLAAFQEVADALNGSPEAANCSVKPPLLASWRVEQRGRTLPALQRLRGLDGKDGLVVFVDPSPSQGSDVTGDGSKHFPFLSLRRALAAVRRARAEAGIVDARQAPQATIVLRRGTFVLGSKEQGGGPLQLGPGDSRITFVSESHWEALAESLGAVSSEPAPEVEVFISGGVPLTGITWQHTPFAAPPRPAYDYRPGSLADGFDVAPAGAFTLQQAQHLCTSIPECAAFAYTGPANASGVIGSVVFKSAAIWSAAPAAGSAYVKNFGYQPGDPPPAVYTANLSSFPLPAGFPDIASLRAGGQRMVRARYPNIRSIGQLEGMQVQASSWTPQSAWGITTDAAYTFTPPAGVPARNDTAEGYFQTFRLGVGGDCAFRFAPAAGYWCANGTQGGGPGPYQAPVAMTVNSSAAGLPHSPYADPRGAVVHTWREGRWFSWAFVVDGASVTNTSEEGSPASVAVSTSRFNFSLTQGGNQGSRGGSAGGEFYIEGVREELDAPGEFYWDAEGQTLILWYNGSAQAAAAAAAADGPAGDTISEPQADSIVAAQLQLLINGSGSQAQPIVDVGFRGIGFRDTAPSYLQPHAMPSGGDWALTRSAALTFEGSYGLVIDACLFTGLDGNGLMLSGYARNASVTRSEFVSIGETAIILWGDTDGSPVPGMGFDASAGNQPRGTIIDSNIIHEVGLWTKQNSAIFQAQAFATAITRNILFNGPRAGINLNDGLGGGSAIHSNAIFNFCRESSDHGPINSWHRQPLFLTDARGQLTAARANDSITGNYIIGNYHSSQPVDNDDGSADFVTAGNVLISAVPGFGSLKSDFGGNRNVHAGNLDLFFSYGFGIITPQLAGRADAYVNNSLWLLGDGDYGSGQACSGPGETVVGGNTVWSPTGNITECGMSLAEWQAAGNDRYTAAAGYPSDEEVIRRARRMLQLK